MLGLSLSPHILHTRGPITKTKTDVLNPWFENVITFFKYVGNVDQREWGEPKQMNKNATAQIHQHNSNGILLEYMYTHPFNMMHMTRCILRRKQKTQTWPQKEHHSQSHSLSLYAYRYRHKYYTTQIIAEQLVLVRSQCIHTNFCRFASSPLLYHTFVTQPPTEGGVTWFMN